MGMMGRVVFVAPLSMVEIPEIKCSENSDGLGVCDFRG